MTWRMSREDMVRGARAAALIRVSCDCGRSVRPSVLRRHQATHGKPRTPSGYIYVPRPKPTTLERFHRSYEVAPSGCWLWTLKISNTGYGQTRVAGRDWIAHRLAYTLLVGPIPDGLTIDHLCRTPRCVNPAHLEAVTMRVNTLRGVGPTARNAAKTHCVKGHPFDEANTKWRPEGGRTCRTCANAHARRYKQRARQKAVAA